MWSNARTAGGESDNAPAGEGLHENRTTSLGSGSATEEGAAGSTEREGSAANVAARCESGSTTAEAAASDFTTGRCVDAKPC